MKKPLANIKVVYWPGLDGWSWVLLVKNHPNINIGSGAKIPGTRAQAFSDARKAAVLLNLEPPPIGRPPFLGPVRRAVAGVRSALKIYWVTHVPRAVTKKRQ